MSLLTLSLQGVPSDAVRFSPVGHSVWAPAEPNNNAQSELYAVDEALVRHGVAGGEWGRALPQPTAAVDHHVSCMSVRLQETNTGLHDLGPSGSYACSW